MPARGSAIPCWSAPSAAAFAREGLRLQCATFDEVLAHTSAGDLVYLDPPYAPLSTTSAFGAYTADRFSPSDQVRLCEAVVDLARRGRHILLSNSSAPEIVALYRQATRAGGARLRLWSVPARRAINSRATGRGVVTELLLTNLEPGGTTGGRWRRLSEWKSPRVGSARCRSRGCDACEVRSCRGPGGWGAISRSPTAHRTMARGKPCPPPTAHRPPPKPTARPPV